MIVMSKVLHPNESEFVELIKDDVVFVDFFAEWCGPCKMLAPEIEKLADAYEGKVKIAKVDVDKEGALAMQYQVQSIPTILIFKNGEMVAREMGFRPYPALAQMIDAQL